MIVEEKLGADIVGSGIDLLLQVIHFLEAVLSFRVSFGEAGYPNPEFFKGCPQVAIEIPNEGNEVGAIVKCVPRPIIGRLSLGKVSAKGEDSWNPRPSITGKDFFDFSETVVDASEVGNRRYGSFFQDFEHQLVGPLAGGAASPVGNADK